MADFLQIFAAICATGAAFFLGMTVYNFIFQVFVIDATEEERDLSFVRSMRGVILRRMADFNRRFIRPTHRQRIKAWITQAGDPDDLTVEEFVAFMEIAAIGFSIFGIVLLAALGNAMIFLPFFTIFGSFYPIIWIKEVIARRHMNILRALPYTLDLLTLSVEAGLDFTGAVGKVVEKGKKGPLREEFNLMLNQLRVGKTREEGLRYMAERANLPPLTNFVNVLIQADRMGTGLGKILRTLSTQMRIDRTQRAEKLAGEAPVKMLFPLVAFIFPCVFLVLFGPLLFRFIFEGA